MSASPKQQSSHDGAAEPTPTTDASFAESAVLAVKLDNAIDEFLDRVSSLATCEAICRALCKLLVERVGYRGAWVLEMPPPGDGPASAVASYGLTMEHVESILSALTTDETAYQAWEDAFRGDSALVRRLDSFAPGVIGDGGSVSVRRIGVFRLDFLRPPRLALVVSADSDRYLATTAVQKLGKISADAALALDRVAHRTRLRAAQDERDEAFQLLDVLVSASPAAMVGVSPAGVIVSANPAAEALAGLPASRLVGKTVREVVSAPVYQGLNHVLNAVLEGKDMGAFEGPLWIRGGRRVWVRAAIAVQRNVKGHLTGLVAVGLDASEERRLARRAQVQERMLARLSGQIVEAVGQERRAIAMGLHDELGQTLAALKLQLGLVMSGDDAQSNEGHPQRAIELIGTARSPRQGRSYSSSIRRY